MSVSLWEERAVALVRHGGLSLGDTGIPGVLWSLFYAASHRWYRDAQSQKKWRRGHRGGRQEREREREKDGRGGRKLAMNICCLSVPSPTGSGNPRIRCAAAAAVTTPALSNTNTMALLSQTKLERWIWKETGSPQSQHCQGRAAWLG